MAKWVKRFAGLFGGAVLLLIVVVIALPFVIDPNDLKGQIQKLAADQGIQLELGGPISWQFFPVVGLSVNDVSVAPLSDPTQPLAQVKEVTAAVALMPLFKQQIRVETLSVDSAAIQLIVDQQGQGNWQALSTNSVSVTTAGPPNQIPAPTADSSSTPVTGNLDLSVDRIRLSNVSLVYDDRQTGERTALRELDLIISNVNTEQRAFPLSLDVIVENSAFTKPLRIALKSQLAVNSQLNDFALQDGSLSLPDAGIELQLSTKANIENDPTFDGTLSASIDNLAALFAVLGLDKPLTADPAVLSKVKFTSTFNGDTEQIKVPVLSLTLDDTTLNGNLAVVMPTDQNSLALTVNLRGNKMDIDRYLAPMVEEASTATPVAIVDSPLPVEPLRNTDAVFNFQFDEIIVNKMPITQLDLAVNGNKGLWQLQKFNANFYQGKLTSNGQLDARTDQAKATFNAELAGLALEPLLMDLADVNVLRGSVQAQVNANTQATSTQQLMKNLIANVNFSGDGLLIDGVNVEQQYCEMVDQIKVGDESEPKTKKTWPQQTVIDQVNGKIVMAESLITIEQVQAQVAHLLLGIKGKLQLDKQDYEVSLPLTLTNNRTSESGCLVSGEFLNNREVNVLGCNGNLASIDPAKQCGLRSGAIGDLAKQALRYNFDRRGGNEKVEEAKEKVDDKKQEVRDKAKDKLKDLLNR
jgi:AsmA protein